MATGTVNAEVVELVARAQAGDGEAFGRIYDLYVDEVFSYVYRRVGQRQTAEDLTGDVFLRALRRLPKFRWQGVDLGAWLVTIARNRVNDYFKSARFRLERTTDEMYERPTESAPDDPERATLAREMARTLARALDGLKDEHREVVELRFVQGLNVAETAAVMHKSPGAIKALQYRAVRALADLIRDEPGLAALLPTSISVLIALLRMATP